MMDFDFRASNIHSRLHSENFSVFNYADEDDDYQSPFQCPSCDLGINLSMLRSSLEEMDCYDPKNMLCPVCDENLGEDATKIVQNSSSTKPAWKSEKSTAWSSNSSMLDKKLIGMGNKHEPVADTLLSPFLCNVSGLNSSGVLPNEDSFYKALGISIAKSSRTDAAADAGNEQDREERRARASFVQELVASTLLENSVP